jgi:Protein of unknown function (DUF3568).
MFKVKKWLLFLIAVVFAVPGCAPVIVGGVATGAASGTYFYITGNMITDYHFSFEEVWIASKEVVAEMHGVDVVPNKEISKGIIDAVIDNEEVRISVKYKSKNVTTVAIRVGIIGSRLSSQRLHDKIAGHLLKR